MGGLEISYLTDIGSRSTNEDKVLVKCFVGLYLLAIADGIGGHAAGEVASGVALIEIEKSLESNLWERDIQKPVKEAVAKANKEVYLLARENDDCAGMGTTLVMALIQQNQVLIANIGDSRAYCLSESHLKQITKDHSVVQVLIERGMITEEEAQHHPQRSSLTRALGVEPEVEVDIYDSTLKPGDILLLYTDGVTEHVNSEGILFYDPDTGGELERTIHKHRDLSSRELFARIKESLLNFAEPQDDASFILIKRKK